MEGPGWKVWLYPGGVSVGLPGGTKVGVGLGVGLVLGVGVGLGVDVELPVATNCECRSCCGPDVDDVTVMAVPTEISTASAVTPLAVASCRGVIANMFLCSRLQAVLGGKLTNTENRPATQTDGGPISSVCQAVTESRLAILSISSAAAMSASPNARTCAALEKVMSVRRSSPRTSTHR